MSKPARQWFKLFAIAAVATGISAVVISKLPEPLNTWFASAAIGALSAMIAFFVVRQNRTLVRSKVMNGSEQGTSETWSAKEWKAWANQQADLLQGQSEAVADRERRLAEKLARYQEVLEFPIESDLYDLEDHSGQLGDADRKVQELLEAEAASVYEKIRSNAYRVQGMIDASLIRADVVDLIQRVAQIYQPDSKQPLLETSFNQLARAFSRICLHCLVLLEQLPIDVRNYTLNELFTYFQRAAKAYGAYQQVAPWMQRLGRTAYAGRFAAGANPVTLGAWWLASEVAQRGAKHVVSNVVDRQAIAVLHDLVSVVGTEVANIYGPGYRQRDAAWVYGTEITELLSQFPVSRESLSQALKETTQLPLKCEYDRIYLYRCLATAKPAGFLLTDSSSLTREQRETIAVGLERFVDEVLHGVDSQTLQVWAAETEQRLDLKLRLGTDKDLANQSSDQQVRECLLSLWGFCTSVLVADPTNLIQPLERLKLLKKLPLQKRQKLLSELEAGKVVEFSIPDLDPASTLLPIYLQDLFANSVATRQCQQHHFELLLETAMHFRLSRDEAMQMMVGACRNELSITPASAAATKLLSDQQVLAAAFAAQADEVVVDAFNSVEVRQDSVATIASATMENPCLLVFKNTTTKSKRLAIATIAFQRQGLWAHVTDWKTQPIEGYVYDDCLLTRLNSLASNEDEAEPSDWDQCESLVLGGSLLNRSYDKRFAWLFRSDATQTTD